jgi:hypothetical protein
MKTQHPVNAIPVRRPLRALVPLITLVPLLLATPPARAAEDPAPAKPGDGLFEFGKDPLKPGAKPKPQPATKPAQIGQAEIRVLSTRLDYVTLGPSTENGPAPTNVDPVNSQDKFLIVTLNVRNASQDRPLTYHTFAFPFGPANSQTYASLGLGRKMLTLVNFGEQEPVGLSRTAAIPPGKSITDVLVFLPIPDLDAVSVESPLRLTLPPQQLGAAGKAVPIELDFANLQKRR